MSTEPLAKACNDTSALANEGERWLVDDANAASVGREREDLIRFTRRISRRATRLERAARRPMCVGVFGPSQAGKSYLVEVLARPQDGALRARFDGVPEPLDFLAEINPIGEKESTGLVTRFSAGRSSPPPPQGVPVRLRILNELDLVKVLANTMLHDGDAARERSLSPDEMDTLLASLRASARTGGERPSAADIDDLHDYVADQARGSRALDGLGRYWEGARVLVENLDLAGRARLFAPLWGSHEPFTRLFLDLAGALERLGFPEEIFAPVEALVPREGSILDVATLTGLGCEGSSNLLTVHGRLGPVALPRPVVAAITAELRIEIADAPRDFLQNADLLDFPGARSRQKIHMSTFLAEQPDALKETFLRGKVAYLFDRYVAEQELTAMLLCIRPSNQEVVTLPDLVERWIAMTHGATPEARAALPNLLFLVMTWFDSHFVDKAGDASHDPGLRFRNRIEASLLGFFGKAHAWPQQWSPGASFRNTFWFRNPNYPAEAVIRYEGRREVAFIEEKRERIAALREGFVALPEATAHFNDPGRAFDEALRLNDGGVSYLVENLGRVCRPELKAGQIASRLDTLRSELRERLGRFHISLDIQVRLDERRAAAGRVFDALDEVVADGRLGSLLRALLTDVAVMGDAMHGAIPDRESGVPSPSTQRMNRLGAIVRPGARAGSPPIPAGEPLLDRERIFARTAIESWIAHMRRSIESEEFARRFAIPVETMEIVVGELIALSRRADVEATIAAALRALTAVERQEQATAKVALIATTRLNRLVGDLGFQLVPPAGAPPTIEAANGIRAAFADRAIVFDARSIGETPTPFAHTYATDWFHGFYKVVEDNAVSVSGVSVNLAQNEALGRILLDLSSPVA